MAMLRLGKLKVRFKDGGIDYLWGDKQGRLGLNRNNAGSDDGYAYDYEEGAGDENLNYGGRFAGDDYGYEDGYDDRDGDYEEFDDRYDDDYADNRYGSYREDDYADDRYADDGYTEDYEPEYDDRYSDEDADDVYSSYADGYRSEYAEGGIGELLRYVDENDWVTYLLLVLLPPLGIYLLWRRQRFEQMIRYGVSAASAVWFIVLIILLCTMIFGGRQDVEERNPLPTLSPTQAVDQVDATESPSAGLDGTPAPTAMAGMNPVVQASASVSPLATPIAGVSASAAPGSLVWASASGDYYHSTDGCSAIGVNEVVTQVTVENASARNKYACPTCYGGETFYATEGGSYYHLDANCSDMRNAEMYTLERANAENKKACPVCVDKTQQTLSTMAPGVSTVIDVSTADKSGIRVWYTEGGVNYHMTSNCRGMSGAKQASLKEAIMAGKTACQTCCESSDDLVYCTKNGTYYHRTSNCSGMSNAIRMTVAEAQIMGKKECPTCKPTVDIPGIDEDTMTSQEIEEHIEQMLNNPEPTSKPANTWTEESESEFGSEGLVPDNEEVAVIPPLADSEQHQDEDATQDDDTEYYVYATKKGKYYHIESDCSGMTNAEQVTLSSMLAEGRPACPDCSGGATTMVYASKGGTYYHSYATCSNMTNAKRGSLSAALALGYKRCPQCWDGGNSGSNGGTGTNNNAVTNNNSGTNGNAGSGGSQGNSTADSIMVYATKNGRSYHTISTCSGMQNASRISLRVAVEAGKSACPTCASGAQTTVYSTRSGRYYHRVDDCSGMSSASKRTLAEALLLGQTACPVCVDSGYDKNESGGNNSGNNSGNNNSGNNSGNNSSNNNSGNGSYGDNEYEPGKSGVMVWANENGKYFHTRSSCSGASGFSHITLETALNYGKTACPECAGTAGKTVYAKLSGRYYHSSKSCAGSGAVSGSLADALAYGFKACPYCISGSNGNDGGNDSDEPIGGLPESSGTFDPGKSGIDVWATTSGAYYHSSQSCAGSGAKKVTLETALNYGKTGCPDCASSANRTVYASADSFYYHSEKYCEETANTKATYAQALAYGLKACPICIGGSEADGVPEGVTPGPEYSALPSTSVFVDLYSDQFYYHKNSSCSGSGMSGGTDVTLEYAVDFGFKRCPYCNPASDIA